MIRQPPLDIARTAVLSMDLQTAIVSAYIKDDLLTRAASVLHAARDSELTTIHVQVGFHPGFPEISPRNSLFHSIKTSVQHQQMFQGGGAAIHPAVAPEGDDILITKHRISAFAGTDLDMILRARNIETLVLFGIATSGVVLSTLLHASDADFRLIVIHDCCADLDPEVHSCLIEKVFPHRAAVLAAGEFLHALKPS